MGYRQSDAAGRVFVRVTYVGGPPPDGGVYYFGIMGRSAVGRCSRWRNPKSETRQRADRLLFPHYDRVFSRQDKVVEVGTNITRL